MKRLLLWVLIIAFCLSAALGIVLFLFGLTLTETEAKILATTVLLGFYSVACLCQSFVWGRRRKAWSLAGLCITVASYATFLLFIWIPLYNTYHDWILKCISIGVLFTVFSTHASLMSVIQSSNKATSRVQSGTISMSLFATLLMSYAVIFPTASSEDIPVLLRLIAVFIILAVLGTVITPILHSLAKKS